MFVTTDDTIAMVNTFNWGMYSSDESILMKSVMEASDRETKKTLLELRRADPDISATELQLMEEEEQEKIDTLNQAFGSAFFGSPAPERIKTRAEKAQEARQTRQEENVYVINEHRVIMPDSPEAANFDKNDFGGNMPRITLAGREVSGAIARAHLNAKSPSTEPFRIKHAAMTKFLQAQLDRSKRVRLGTSVVQDEMISNEGIEGDVMPLHMRDMYAQRLDEFWNDANEEGLDAMYEDFKANYTKVLKLD